MLLVRKRSPRGQTSLGFVLRNESPIRVSSRQTDLQDSKICLPNLPPAPPTAFFLFEPQSRGALSWLAPVAAKKARLWFWLLALRVDLPGLHALAWLAGIDELTGITYVLEARVHQAPSLEKVRKRDLYCGESCSFLRYGLIICSRPSLFTTLTDAVFPLARS